MFRCPDSFDVRILDMVSQVERSGAKSVKPIKLGMINEAHADVLHELTGVDYSGYSIVLTGDSIQHTINRHGKNGQADQSMANVDDIARLGWVVENFDRAALAGKSGAYSDSSGKPANVVVLQKRVNGFYYVSEIVPDTKNKKLYIQSAYRNDKSQKYHWVEKNEDLAGGGWNVNRPPDVQNAPASIFDGATLDGGRHGPKVASSGVSSVALDNDTIPQSGGSVNTRSSGRG